MTTEPIIKILLIDDNRFFMEALSYIIEANKQLKVIGIANTGKEALKKMEETHPDIVIIDVVLPDINGIRLAKEIFQRRKDLQIIVLSIYKDPEFIKAAQKVGVFAYLFKDEPVDIINRTILEACRALKNQPVPKT